MLLDFYQQRASSFFTSMSHDIKQYPLCFRSKVLQGSQKVKVRLMWSPDYKSSCSIFLLIEPERKVNFKLFI